MKSHEIPSFGVMQGVKVLSTGTGYAGPFSATLMGELGADVIGVEPPTRPEISRSSVLSFSVEHRNQRKMTLDIPSLEGRKVFKRLIEWADIWIESSKGGTYAKWGLSDEVLWSYNKKLVIVHVSGYGQAGDPDYVKRPAYDSIAQAFSGYMHWNGEDGSEPLKIKPYMADFVPPIHAAFVAVAALRRAEQTGVGESIDFAQYETLVRLQSMYLVEALNHGRQVTRRGNREAGMSVNAVFRCADGDYIATMISGKAMWTKAIPLLGLTGKPEFADPPNNLVPGTPAADMADAAVADLCAKFTAAEIEKMFNEAGVSCARVFSPSAMESNAHYRARETITTWHDEFLDRDLRVPNIVPPLAKNKNQIWRSGAPFNIDTDDILEELGYTDAQRAELYRSGACKAP